MSNFFSKCEIVKLSEFTITRGGEVLIDLPFSFYIGNIFDGFTTEIDSTVAYSEQYENMKTKKTILDWLSDVDLESLTLDESIEGYEMVYTREGYIFKDTNNLYNFLMDIIGLNENEVVGIMNFVQNSRADLVEMYRDMVIEELKLGDNKNSKNIDITEGFMLLQGALEHCVPPIFEENVGRVISKYSWRELFTQRIYLARKYEIEKLMREQAEKDAKNKKK